jgi:hypothetical protein
VLDADGDLGRACADVRALAEDLAQGVRGG